MSNPDFNPYSTPAQPGNFSAASNPDPSGILVPPAIALMVVSVIGLLGMSGYFVLTLIGVSQGAVDLPPAANEAEKIGQQVGFYGVIILMGVNIVLQLLILAAGFCMLKRKSYLVSMLGTIAACCPFVGSSCCLLSIPFGIWAFVVLLNRDVRQKFQ